MKLKILLSFLAIAFYSPVTAKPLKVFILCGQSNMEGHAQTKTFPAIAKDPKTAHLHRAIIGADGKALVHNKKMFCLLLGNKRQKAYVSRSMFLIRHYT